jgi:transaldolase
VRAYEPDGLSVGEFDTWAPTVRTLRAFIASYHELLHLVGDALLPNPDA